MDQLCDPLLGTALKQQPRPLTLLLVGRDATQVQKEPLGEGDIYIIITLPFMLFCTN